MSAGSSPRRILVTGGATGIGAAIVRTLVAAGYDVDFTYRASAEAAQSLLVDLRAAHPERTLAAHPIDLADKVALDGFCEVAEAAGYYGLIHNAGQPCDALAAMLDQERAEAAMQVNFFSLTRLAKALVREHVGTTDSRWAKGLLDDWDAALGRFWQVVPREMLTRLSHPLDDRVELVAAE